MNLGYLIGALTLNSIANILLKIAALGKDGTTIKALIANPYAVVGVMIFASNVYLYIQALKNLPLSFVYPVMTAASFIIINSYSFIFLKEPWSITSLIGYLLMILGIVLVASRI